MLTNWVENLLHIWKFQEVHLGGTDLTTPDYLSILTGQLVQISWTLIECEIIDVWSPPHTDQRSTVHSQSGWGHHHSLVSTGQCYLFDPHSSIGELMDHRVGQTGVPQQKRGQSLIVFQDVLDL